MDTYGGGMGVLIIAIFETTVIMWIYGVGRFSDDLKFMFNSEPIHFFGKIGWGITQICWSITPIILTAIFAITCVYWETPIYKGNVHYPDWVHGVGWFLILVVALQVCNLWQYGLWSFQTGGTKLERVLPKNQHTQRQLLNFEAKAVMYFVESSDFSFLSAFAK